MIAIVERNGYRFRVQEKELDKYLKQHPGAKVVTKPNATTEPKAEQPAKGKSGKSTKQQDSDDAPEKEQASS